MDDRELIERAAKAAGIVGEWGAKEFIGPDEMDFTDIFFVGDAGVWNPLEDDGDALRLAVKLRIDLEMFDESLYAHMKSNGYAREDHRDDPCAATRRAIVRAAAELGAAS